MTHHDNPDEHDADDQPGPTSDATQRDQQDVGLDGGTAGADQDERVGDDD